MSTTERPRILVVGGGYVGLYAARRILKKMRYGEATVTVHGHRNSDMKRFEIKTERVVHNGRTYAVYPNR